MRFLFARISKLPFFAACALACSSTTKLSVNADSGDTDAAAHGGAGGLPSGNGGGAADAGSDVDTGGAGPSCDPFAPFTSIKAVTELNTQAAEGSARLTANEYNIYFYRRGSSSADLLTATRTNRQAQFTFVTAFANLNGSSNEYGPWVTDDHFTVVFETDRPGGPGLSDLWRAQRSDSSGPFAEIAPIEAINSSYDDQSPYVAAGYLVFASRRSDIGYDDLFEAPWTADTTSTNAQPLAGVNTPMVVEISPILSSDGLVLYFSRYAAMGSSSILRAQRDVVGGTFSTPEVVSELQAQGENEPTWISADNCRLYFMRAVQGGTTGRDIYMAERSP